MKKVIFKLVCNDLRYFSSRNSSFSQPPLPPPPKKRNREIGIECVLIDYRKTKTREVAMTNQSKGNFHIEPKKNSRREVRENKLRLEFSLVCSTNLLSQSYGFVR